jgi:hypothetical protein
MRAVSASICSGVLAAAVLLLLAAVVPAHAQPGPFTESAIKAAYLYHFGTYVDWPPPDSPGDAITIAVLGDDDVFEQLDRYLPGRTINERPVNARRLRAFDELGDEEIVYLGAEVNRRLDTLLPDANGRLVVTDTPDGIESGAIINFTRVDNLIRFEIDRAAATESGLSLSSRLLAAAVRVIGDL